VPLSATAVSTGASSWPAASGVIRCELFFAFRGGQDVEAPGSSLVRATVPNVSPWSREPEVLAVVAVLLAPPLAVGADSSDGLLLEPAPGLDAGVVVLELGDGDGDVLELGDGETLVDGDGLLVLVGDVVGGGDTVGSDEFELVLPFGVAQFGLFRAPPDGPDPDPCWPADWLCSCPAPLARFVPEVWPPEWADPVSEPAGAITSETPAAM
jgi:hypothetical protein